MSRPALYVQGPVIHGPHAYMVACFLRRHWHEEVDDMLPAMRVILEEARTAIGASLEKTFAFLFEQLAVSGTKKLVAKFVTVPEIHQPVPAGGVKAGKRESVDGLAD